MKEGNKGKYVTINKTQNDWLERNAINLTKYVNNKINAELQKELKINNN